jgi:hypothetical protein
LGGFLVTKIDFIMLGLYGIVNLGYCWWSCRASIRYEREGRRLRREADEKLRALTEGVMLYNYGARQEAMELWKSKFNVAVEK